jgi:hypothetical protein
MAAPMFGVYDPYRAQLEAQSQSQYERAMRDMQTNLQMNQLYAQQYAGQPPLQAVEPPKPNRKVLLLLTKKGS